jgi:hypothetical protein
MGDEQPPAGVQLSAVRSIGDPANHGFPHTEIEP